MYEWLLNETLDVRFILLVIFAVCLIVGLVGMIHGYAKPIPDGTGKRRATAETPDPERKPEVQRQHTVRFVDADEDGPGMYVDTETGEELTDEEVRSRLTL